MKATKVRVKRECQIATVETVDVEIIQDDGDSASPERLAERLIQAQDAAGQDVDWKVVSEKTVAYPAPDYSTEVIPPPSHE